MKIYYYTIFVKAYKKLPKEIKILAENAEKIFINNPFDQRLRTHKLSGKFLNFWSFSINYKYRIIFEFMPEDIVHFHYVGRHDIYK